MQRVKQASVRVGGSTVSAIETGLLALVGAEVGDDEEVARHCAGKVATLRVFPDPEGKMNLDVGQTGGAVLVVSQFTLAADTRKGRRPSFAHAAAPDVARPLVELFARELRQHGLEVGEGRFGAAMEVSLVNDGPVTILVEKRSPEA